MWGERSIKNAKNMNLKDGLSVKDDYIMRRVIGYSILSVLIVTLVFILFEYSRLHKLYEYQIKILKILLEY